MYLWWRQAHIWCREICIWRRQVYIWHREMYIWWRQEGSWRGPVEAEDGWWHACGREGGHRRA